MDRTYTIDRQTSQFVTEYTSLCYKCGDNKYFSYECNERRITKEKQAAIKRFVAVQGKFSNRHREGSSYTEAFKRNRSQSKARQQEVAERLLKLEIKMTTMHNLLMRIANKV
jgi:hypothetical protein